MGRYRVVFMGTPAFAVPSLDALVRLDDAEVAAVVTQPDRPAGRGRRLTPPAVKVAATAHGLPVLQVATLRDAVARARLVALAPDAFVVAAFGLILGRKSLAIPKVAAINVHASLLPAYRGASPIAAAIACGEQETGVTLMRMDPGLDTGPMYVRNRHPIAQDDTTETLTEELARLGAEMVSTYVPLILAGDITPKAQSGPASLTRPLAKADGWLDWSLPAKELVRWVRAMTPWPRTWTTLPDGTMLHIHAATVTAHGDNEAPGTVAVAGDVVSVACDAGRVAIVTAQVAGGRAMPGIELVRGRKLVAGDCLGRSGRPAEIAPLVQTVPE